MRMLSMGLRVHGYRQRSQMRLDLGCGNNQETTTHKYRQAQFATWPFLEPKPTSNLRCNCAAHQRRCMKLERGSIGLRLRCGSSRAE